MTEAEKIARAISAAKSTVPWEVGLPPGDYYEGALDDFEVYFSPGGVIYHRRRLAA